jgi:hypothetical protein
MNEEIEEMIKFFEHRQKKLFDCLKDNYTIDKHNEFYDIVDIVKDLHELLKMKMAMK